MMTSLYTHGYAEIAMTPNQLVDFSNGESVVSFDVSTLRTAGRDWIDLWITPFSDVIENPVDNGTPDLSDAPNRAVQIELPPVFGLTGQEPGDRGEVGQASLLAADAEHLDSVDARGIMSGQ